MDSRFTRYMENLHEKYEHLMAMEPVTMESLLHNTPEGGVYLFSEGASHLYVGRSKLKLNKRLRGHIRKSAKDSPLAFKLAREATGQTVTSYSGDYTREKLLSDPEFFKVYQDAKKRIRRMNIRWVHEPVPTKQALLEIYVSVVLETPYNDFDTH
jgi:hypothetical protein